MSHYPLCISNQSHAALYLIFNDHQSSTTSAISETDLQQSEAPARGTGGDQQGEILLQLPVAKSKGLRSYCFTSEAGKAVILEEPDGVTGLVSLRKTKSKSHRGLRQMANSVTGTLRRGVRLRRSLALSWEGTFANPPHWSTESIGPPLEYVRWFFSSISDSVTVSLFAF